MATIYFNNRIFLDYNRQFFTNKRSFWQLIAILQLFVFITENIEIRPKPVPLKQQIFLMFSYF
jgi:hypothetical protein